METETGNTAAGNAISTPAGNNASLASIASIDSQASIALVPTEPKNRLLASVRSAAHPANPYDSNNLIMYHTSLSAIEAMMIQEGFPKKDLRRAKKLLSSKYRFPEGSIFTEV